MFMCVRTWVCEYVCVYVCVDIRACPREEHARASVSAQAWAQRCGHAGACVCIDGCMDVRTCVRVDGGDWATQAIRACAKRTCPKPTNTHARAHTQPHTHTHTHTHTPLNSGLRALNMVYIRFASAAIWSTVACVCCVCWVRVSISARMCACLCMCACE